MKKLVVSGCSFTFEKWNWPAYVAQYLGLDLDSITNVGMGSQGNGLIAKKAIYAVTEELKHFSSEELLVGIMWSGPDRFAFYSEDVYRSKNWGNNAMVSNIENPTRIGTDSHQKWYILNPGWDGLPGGPEVGYYYYRYFHSNIGARIATLESILLTQWFLQDKGVKYFMTSYMDIFQKHDPNLWSYPDLKYLYDLVDFSKFLPTIGCYEYLKENFPEGVPTGDGFHPFESGHKYFTNHCIVPFLQDRFNL